MNKALILLLILIFGSFFLFGFLNTTGYLTFDQQTAQEPTCREIQETYIENSLQEVRECGTVKYTEYGCEERQLKFSSNIDNIPCEKKCAKDGLTCKSRNEATGECESWGYGCVGYSLTCKLSMTNLDEETGIWHIQWYSRCKEDQICNQETKNLDLNIYTLDPGEMITSSSTVEFDAGAELSLEAKFVKIPTYNFCGDIEKTREQCETVTKQVPVEKIRTNTVCD